MTTDGPPDRQTDARANDVAPSAAGDEVESVAVARHATMLNALPASIALVDAHGVIVDVNEAWRQFGPGGAVRVPESTVGCNYLAICDATRGEDEHDAQEVAHGIRRVLGGELQTFSLEYPCHSPTAERWFRVTVTPVHHAGGSGAVIMHVDITERRIAEATAQRANDLLRETNERFGEMADHITDAFWIRSPDMRQLHYISPGFARIWGRSVESLYAHPERWADFPVPEDRERVVSTYRLLAADTPSIDLEYRMHRPDGQIRWVRVRGFQVPDEQGRVVRLTGIASDITERKEIEETLQRQNTEMRVLFDYLPAMICFKDTKNVIIKANRALAQAVGKDVTEIEGRNSSEIFPQDADNYYADDLLVIESGVPRLGIVETVLDHTGRTLAIQTDKVPVCDSQGDVTGVVVMAQDITERNCVQEALRASEARFRSLIEATTAIVWDMPGSGEFVSEQPRWSRFTGQTFAEYRGWGWIEAIHPDDREPTTIAWLDAIARRGLYEVEQRVRRSDHTYCEMLVRAVPILAADGTIREWVGLHVDINERKLAEQAALRLNLALQAEIVERRRAEDAADAANRLKSEFLANMSHEVRTPLNGVVGITELVLATDLTPEQRDYLNIIKSSGESLLTVINDILDFSKFEAGRLAVDVIPFNLAASLMTTLRPLAPRAQEKGLELTCDIDATVPTDVLGDPGRLRQIITNLVGNAVKFTTQGEVVLSVAVESRGAERAVVRFSISDTGIGIPADQRQAIFRPFVQADGSTTRKFGGTGLGLSISQTLATLLGGRLWLDSESGAGSTFHCAIPFDLPISSAPASREPDIRMDRLRDVPVLVVDDNAVNRRLLGATVARWHMKPVLAAHGAAAIEAMAQRAATNAIFPLVLLDAQMPGMDGFTVAEAVQRDTRLRGSTILLLTSAGRHGDGARCRELGIAAYLMKPVSQAELLEAIHAALGRTHIDGTAAAVVTRHSLREGRRKLRILLAEDNKVNQMVATRMLEKQGHTVVVADDGVQAVAAVSGPDGATFDVVLMDVQMPHMDGFAATARIRADEVGTDRHMPIIAVTAHAMKGDDERCLAAGMDGYLSKPIQSEQLREIIDRVTASRPG